MKLGKAFTDSVSQEKIIRMSGAEDRQSWWFGRGRVLLFTTILLITLFILGWRLFDLTIVRGHEFRSLADGNRTRELIRHAPRGVFLDRTGKPLVTNVPQYRYIGESTKIITKEAGDEILASGLTPGIYLESDWGRRYTYDSLSIVTGFTGELNEKELQEEFYAIRGYKLGDKIGSTAAEAVFEDTLRGRDGKELVEVDAQGSIVRTLGVQKEIAGTDVTLAIDAMLQEVAASSFPAGQKGAVVISKPTTGEILGLYSSPSYSSNKFSVGMSLGEYQTLMADPDEPFLNRAIGGNYPPGSTFKIVMALAGLEEGVITSDTTVTDNGTITIGPFSFSNWYFTQYGKVEGELDITRALKRSNDIFFYKVGDQIGITNIAKWSHKVGIGSPLGIELPGEAAGLVPDPAWKKERFNTAEDRQKRNDQWYLGDTYHISIGQGYLLTTPLQVNAWTNVIANNGILCRPTIEKVTSDKRHESRCKDLKIKKETLELITQGMKDACATGGTGWPLFNFSASSSGVRREIPIACKTGTAEFGDPEDKTHAWITAYAPIESPEISITVLVEEGGEGSSVAGPIAKKIFESWFSR